MPMGAMVFGEKMGKLLDDIDIMKRNMATKDDIKKILDILDKLDKKLVLLIRMQTSILN